MGSYETTMLKLERMAQSNTAQGQKWQKEMSDTSHQREVKDLIAAGLNPVLSSNQGAQSYTTQVDSAVNGIAGMASAREGANATRYAARQSAAATRAAAYAQVAAAQIAADASKWNTAHSKSGSVAGVASNFINDLIGVAKDKGIVAAIGKSLRSSPQNMLDNPNKYLKDPNQKWSASNMTYSAKQKVYSQIKELGITTPSSTVINWYIDGMFNNNRIAQRNFRNYLSQHLQNKHNSARR